MSALLLGAADATATPIEIEPRSDGRAVPMVVGGRDAVDGTWQFAVHLQVRRWDGSRHACTGSLVSPTQVVTAAHCVLDDDGMPFSPSAFTVTAGVVDLRTPERPLVEVAAVRAHPAYDAAAKVHDIAVVSLVEPLPLAPIRVATPQEAGALVPGRPLVAAGWGRTDPFDPAYVPSTLQVAELPFLDDTACGQAWRHLIASAAMVCTLTPGGGRGVCSGDSGGPLVTMLATGEPVLIGVTSFGSRSCGSATRPDVYTEAPAYAAWIGDEHSTDAPSSATVRYVDRAAPRVRLSATWGRPGRIVKLVFGVTDDSGWLARIRFQAFDRHGRRLSTAAIRNVAEGNGFVATWRIPQPAAAPYVWCITATDAAGRFDHRCSRLRVR